MEMTWLTCRPSRGNHCRSGAHFATSHMLYRQMKRAVGVGSTYFSAFRTLHSTYKQWYLWQALGRVANREGQQLCDKCVLSGHIVNH